MTTFSSRTAVRFELVEAEGFGFSAGAVFDLHSGVKGAWEDENCVRSKIVTAATAAATIGSYSFPDSLEGEERAKGEKLFWTHTDSIGGREIEVVGEEESMAIPDHFGLALGYEPTEVVSARYTSSRSQAVLVYEAFPDREAGVLSFVPGYESSYNYYRSFMAAESL